MTKEGAALGVELSELWLCGRSYLPNAARATAQASTLVGTAGQTAVGSEVFPIWDSVRDELQRILAEAADNLYATSDALVRVANTYAATDAAAKTEMHRLIWQYRTNEDYQIDDPTLRPPLYPTGVNPPTSGGPETGVNPPTSSGPETGVNPPTSGGPGT
jgi:hypothetical protein